MADLGDLAAVGFTYVSPAGQLILYTADRRVFEMDGVWTIEGGECAASGYPTRSCRNLFPAGWDQTYDLVAGQTLLLRGASYVEPWVRLYADPQLNANHPGGSVLTMDWADQSTDHFERFGGAAQVGYEMRNGLWWLDDWTSSFEWCGPDGAALGLYADPDFSGSPLQLRGSGGVQTFDITGGSLDDKVSSARLTWTPPSDSTTNLWSVRTAAVGR
jgi:hypothetical protein